MALGFWETLVSLNADGTALTAAARASLTQGAGATSARYTMPANRFKIGDVLQIKASGRISCAVTTPGTARFDLAAGATVIYDSLAMNLNIVAKSNVGWELIVEGIVRAIGVTGNILWQGPWISEAVIASPLPTVGGSGVLMTPYNTPPVVGANFDTTISALWDFFFTQTVATGSCQLHKYSLALKTSSGF